jgi:predicted acylesterase/phospholipase RssA
LISFLYFLHLERPLLAADSQMIHRTGNSARAIRASVSIPGVMPPVPKNGELLIDGGVLNNLPIDVMRELNESGTILALDVVSPKGPSAKDDYGLSLSGWRQFFRRLNPWQKPQRAPGIGTVLMLSMTLGSGLLRKQILRRKLADFYHNIHVKGVRMLEFEAVDRAVKIGYESYTGPLRQWLRLNDIHQNYSEQNHKKQ